MSEFIGSRISLISKSDIKYIGTLHEINSDNHTVALESVTSHGTEGRKGNPAEEVPGSDQIYEYIVFRGSDVKDLTIIENASQKENQAPQVPNDPAILGSQRPPQPPQQQQTPQQPPPHNQQQQFGYQGPPPPPRFQGPGGPHGFPGQPGAVPGYGFPPPGPHGPPPQGFGMGYGPPPGHGFPHGPPPGHFGPGQHMPGGPPGQMNQQRPPQHMQRTPQPPVGSKEGTPQPPQDQLQPPPQPSQTQQRPFEMSATPGPGLDSSAGPPPSAASKASVAAAPAPSAPTQGQQPPKPTPKANARVAVPLPGARPLQKPPTMAQAAAAPPPNAAPPPQSIDDATQAATAAVAAAMAKLGPVNNNQPANATDNLTQKVAQMRINDTQQRGRGRGRGNYARGGRRESAQKQIDVPKEDYDFESANAKFNKQDLVKEAIASGSPIASPNGEAKDPIANGDTNGHDEEDVVIPPAKSTEKSYDKQNSFFDNISSDLKDREAAQMGDRRQERSKNFETFGQGSVDGGRGGYRGRRGYRGNQRGYRGDGGRGRGRGFTPYV